MAEDNLGGGGRRIGSVKAAINKYGQKATTRSISAQLDSPVLKSSSVAEELHRSGKELGIYTESRKDSESTKAKAEAELRKAKKTVQELTLLIKESNLRLPSRTKLNNDGNGEITRELEEVKQEVSKLKLDIASVANEKAAAEKEVMEVRSKIEESLKSVESLKLEVDVANEEHVLVELAKIEALKERKAIEEQSEVERKEAFDSLEKRKKRMREMTKEIEKSKEIENVLSETLSDILVLETQLKLVKDMEGSKNRSIERGNDILPMLKEVTEATEAKKEELGSINAELVRLVDEIDTLRQELEQAKQETASFDKILRKDDAMIERLNSKLLMAKAKF